MPYVDLLWRTAQIQNFIKIYFMPLDGVDVVDDNKVIHMDAEITEDILV